MDVRAHDDKLQYAKNFPLTGDHMGSPLRNPRLLV